MSAQSSTQAHRPSSVPSGLRAGGAAIPRAKRSAACVELDPHERRVLGRQHPEVAGFTTAYVIVARGEVADDIRQAVQKVVDATNRKKEADVEAAIEMLLATNERARVTPPQDPYKQAQFRMRVLRDYPAHTGLDVAARCGSKAQDPSQVARRWRVTGRVFSVPFSGNSVYFRFQFGEDGRPLPAVAGILRLFTGWDGWDIAAWFVTPNPLLDRRIPADLLTERPENVFDAAQLDARVRRSR